MRKAARPFAPTIPTPPATSIGRSTSAGSATAIPQAGAYQVPDFDFNYGLGDRIQLKYEIPIAIEETRAQPATPTQPAIPGQVIGGLGESLLGIKWRFYEHHPNDPWLKNRFGTGLLGVFGHHATQPEPSDPEDLARQKPPSPSPTSASPPTRNSILDNPTRSVPRGVVAPGPNFFLPIEVNGRIGPIRFDGEVGYNFGNHALPQSWDRGLLVGHEFTDRTEAYLELYDQQDANTLPAGQGVGQFATGGPKQRETTLGLGGRQTLNHSKTLNLLLMAGRSFQTITNHQQPAQLDRLRRRSTPAGPRRTRHAPGRTKASKRKQAVAPKHYRSSHPQLRAISARQT